MKIFLFELYWYVKYNKLFLQANNKEINNVLK